MAAATIRINVYSLLMDYNQTILKPNEFIISAEWVGSGLGFKIRNPHIDVGNDGNFDQTMLEAVVGIVGMGRLHLEQLDKDADFLNKPPLTDDRHP